MRRCSARLPPNRLSTATPRRAELTFACQRAGQWEWYQLRVVDAVLTGRFSSAANAGEAGRSGPCALGNRLEHDRFRPRASAARLRPGRDPGRRRADHPAPRHAPPSTRMPRAARWAGTSTMARSRPTRLPSSAMRARARRDRHALGWRAAVLCDRRPGETPALTYNGFVAGAELHGTVEGEWRRPGSTAGRRPAAVCWVSALRQAGLGAH